MALPKTYRAFRRTDGELPRNVRLSEETLPETLNANDVLIKIHAVSLNYRDVAMLHGKYHVPVQDRGIAASDCAAEVVAFGSAVQDFTPGDRVSPIFNLSSITGVEDEASVALGGDAAGVLREYAVFDAKDLVRLPEYLSWEEVSIATPPWETGRLTGTAGCHTCVRRGDRLVGTQLARIPEDQPQRTPPRQAFLQ